MGFFNDWDDLIHGTLLFGALVPWLLTFALGYHLPRHLGIATGLALAAPLLWFFGLPTRRFGSDDAVIYGFTLAVLLAGLDGLSPFKSALRTAATAALGVALWAALAWIIYPAWLATDGGTVRRFLIAALLSLSITGISLIFARHMHRQSAPPNLTPAALIPLGVSLTILLVLGGATQFAQSSGAIAASISAVCLVLLRKPTSAGLGNATLIWTMLLGFLAWAGWYFAEIQPLAAALLFLSPFAAIAARRLALPRRTPLLTQTWDLLAASLAVAPVLMFILIRYFASGDDLDGYSNVQATRHFATRSFQQP